MSKCQMRFQLLECIDELIVMMQFSKSLGAENVEKQLNISAIWYQSSDNKGHSPSGAYLFRPVGTHGPGGPIKTEVIKGPVVTEFRQVSFHIVSSCGAMIVYASSLS